MANMQIENFFVTIKEGTVMFRSIINSEVSLDPISDSKLAISKTYEYI